MKRLNGLGEKALRVGLGVVMSVMAFPAAALAQVGEGASSALQAVPLVSQEVSYDISWYTSDPGSDEFGIGNEAQLRGLAELVNGTALSGGEQMEAVSFQGKTIYLDGDIVLKGGSFTPIGAYESKDDNKPFAGTFDGQGHAIRGVQVDARAAHAGLFGYVSADGVLQNVRLLNGNGTAASPTGGIVVNTDSEYVGCIGSLAGQCDGTVNNCSSELAVSVDSTAQATEAHPYIVQRVGGLVGFARGDISGCSYAGALNVQVYSDTVDADTSSESLRVADSFGGIVGRFGDPDRHGTLSDSWNEGDVVVQTHGAGAKDRFGTTTYACAFFVGGIAGYSNGSVTRCHNGAFNVDTREVTGRVFTGVYAPAGSSTLAGNRGADQTGGIVGGLRSVSDNPDKYNDGDPDDPVAITDCYNESQVTGLVAVGGIVGETGVYCSVKRCYNGTITDLGDWTRNQMAGKVVSTRWNKPMTGGIAGQLHAGSVSYCANYAEVRNVQTGYYTAGIAGCVFISDDYPMVTGEIYSCFNSGGVYTVNTTPGVEFREAGICGENEGYVHDCIVMQGTVPYHDDSPIGADDWGATANLYVKSSAELASSQGAAILNAIAAQQGDWSCYWFVNRVGYPVLNSWATGADRIELTAASIKSAVQDAPAPWMGEGSSPVPTLRVTLADGTELVQNADFLVVPQAGAWEMSGGKPYRAGITGIGLYRGTVADCASYDIGSCDLALAATSISPKKYAFGRVVFPTEVTASVGGSPISPSQIDYIIYNRATSDTAVREGRALFPVFDSAGYISYTADGSLKEPVANMPGGVEALNAETRDWWLYDRNYDLISDSAGNSYYTSASGSSAGRVYGANMSCVNLKGGSPAGYVVKFMPKSGSESVMGTTIGYYVIDPVDLYRECTMNGATAAGQNWLWDIDKAQFYTVDSGSGERDYDVSVTFTGESIQPVPSLAYGDYALREGVDYRLSYGDPDPAEGGAATDTGTPNRNVTTVEGAARAGLTVLPQNTSNMSNYIIAYFSIKPAAFEDCEVSLATDEWAYTGEEVRPPVKVTLNGVELQEGVDYTIGYSNNTQKGTATYTVTALDNLKGGAKTQESGTFQITDGVSLADFTLGEIADQQFNWGYDVHPQLVFKRDGAEVALVEGVDYTVSYSKATVTKWSEETHVDKCVATVTGIGTYTGQLTGEFDIVPYDATNNETGQLRAFLQDLSYGMWGLPPTKKQIDGVEVYVDGIENVGLEYPVMMVQARPIVDWSAYDRAKDEGASQDELEESGCYGAPITMGTKNDNDNGGLVNRYPMRCYDAANNEVNGNGGVYLSGNNEVIARPTLAQPGAITAKVELRCGTGGTKGGAQGMLECGTFQYGAPLALSDVTWSVGDACVYDGAEKSPTGTTRSGMQLVEGEDYTIQYTESDRVHPGTVHFAVSAVEGEGKHFTGSFQGAFSIMPANLSTADNVTVDGFKTYYLVNGDVAAAGICPEPVVRVGDSLLQKGVDYELSYLNNRTTGTATVFANGKGLYTGTASATFDIFVRVDLTTAEVGGIKDATWTGAEFKCVPTVRDGASVLTDDDCTVTYLRNGAATNDFTSAGDITVRITAKSDRCYGTRDVVYRIGKAANTISVTASNRSVTYSTANTTVANPLAVVGAQGAVTFAKTSGSAAFTVAPNGTVTVKGGTPAGTYPLGIAANAAGDANHNAGSVTREVKVTVAKATNTITATAASPSVVFSAANRTIANPLSVKGAQGGVTFSKKSGSNNFTVASNGGITVKAGTPVGTYTLGVTTAAAGDANHNAGSVTREVKLTVAKAANAFKVKAVKAKQAVKRGKQVTLKAKKVWKVTKNASKGKVTYKRVKGNKKITVKKNGNVIVAKGLKAGTYTVKVKATAAATKNYKAASKTVTLKVKVS